MTQNLETTKEKPKERQNIYRTSATFTMPKEDLENYRDQVMNTIKIARMSLMSDGEVMKWLDKEIAKFPKEETKEEKT